MTRAAFVKAVVALLWPGEAEAVSGENWYAPYAAVAETRGLLAAGDLAGGWNAPMPRQEMALLAVRAAAARGETAERRVPLGNIFDYVTVGEAYRDAVWSAFSMGLLLGVDDHGRFAPEGALSRAAASMVLYRLIDPSARPEVDFSVATPESPSSLAAGIFYSDPDNLRPTLDADATFYDAKSKLNGFIGNLYQIRFFTNGMSMNDNERPGYAKVLRDADGHWGIQIFQWRKSYDTNVAVNSALNAVLEGLWYFSGDKQVACGLWHWNDNANILGYANSDDYGFYDLEVTDDDNFVIALRENGYRVSVHHDRENRSSDYYFLGV